jgi:hypothetical protein
MEKTVRSRLAAIHPFQIAQEVSTGLASPVENWLAGSQSIKG